MAFTIPKLKYALADLEPYLSKHQVSVHYNKHATKYFDTVNKLVKGTVFEKKTDLLDLISKDTLVKADTALFNNARQAWNHVFYFDGLTPESNINAPSDDLLAAITKEFGSLDEFKKKFTETAVGILGSGWCWLVIKDDKLSIITTSNAETPMTSGKSTPLWCVDVWEHSYLYQDEYEANRQAYVDALWNIICWDTVSQRFVGNNG